MADDEKVAPVEPIHGLKVLAVRPFGVEERPPRRGSPARKRTEPKSESSLPCTVTSDKVDCKI